MIRVEYDRTMEGDFQRVVARARQDDNSLVTAYALVGPSGAVSLQVHTNRPHARRELAEGMYVHAFDNRWAGTSIDGWSRLEECDLLPGGKCWFEFASALQASEVWDEYVAAGRDLGVIFEALRVRYPEWTRLEREVPS